MKIVVIVVAVLAGALTATLNVFAEPVTPSSVRPMPITRTLICRGAGDTRIAVHHSDAAIPGAARITVYLRPGRIAGNPGPNECTWLDRGMEKGQDAMLTIASNTIKFSFVVNRRGMIEHDYRGPYLHVEGVHLSSEAANWEHIITSVMRGGTFKVGVRYIDGRSWTVRQVIRPCNSTVNAEAHIASAPRLMATTLARDFIRPRISWNGSGGGFFPPWVADPADVESVRAG